MKLIEWYKENDYDYYRYLYLGETVGLGTNVYNINLFHPLEELPSDDPIQHIAYAVDAGHINSITTCLTGGITALNILISLNTYYSFMNPSYKKAPSDLVPEVYKLRITPTYMGNTCVAGNCEPVDRDHTWGIPQPNLYYCALLGITPTYMGNTLLVFWEFLVNKDHPHIHGEY